MSKTYQANSTFDDIPSFIQVAEEAVKRAASAIQMRETLKSRVLRRFSVSEVADFLGCNRSLLYTLMKHEAAPQGEMRGRENTFSVEDILRFRAIWASAPTRRRNDLHWRRSADDPLPVVTFCSQKGGTSKTLSAAHFAQYLQLYYGLRVAVIDGDPQGTCSLYFVDQSTAVGHIDVQTFADFMGIPDDGSHKRVIHNGDELDTFFQATPWPGIRLIPGGASAQAAEIEIHNILQTARGNARRVHTYLRDAIDRWSKAHPPVTQPEDLADEDGNFLEDRFQEALTETFDVIIIDTAPALTLTQFNAVYAASTLIIPQTMRGFDLAALHGYLSNLADYFDAVQAMPNAAEFPMARPFILPAIVGQSSGNDIRSIGEIMGLNANVISPVYYGYSEGATNAFREFKSVYEYEPDRNRRASLQRFRRNANAVNDAIASRSIPHLPSRGFANEFIRESYPEGAVPMWTDDRKTPLEAAE